MWIGYERSPRSTRTVCVGHPCWSRRHRPFRCAERQEGEHLADDLVDASAPMVSMRDGRPGRRRRRAPPAARATARLAIRRPAGAERPSSAACAREDHLRGRAVRQTSGPAARRAARFSASTMRAAARGDHGVAASASGLARWPRARGRGKYASPSLAKIVGHASALASLRPCASVSTNGRAERLGQALAHVGLARAHEAREARSIAPRGITPSLSARCGSHRSAAERQPGGRRLPRMRGVRKTSRSSRRFCSSRRGRASRAPGSSSDTERRWRCRSLVSR